MSLRRGKRHPKGACGWNLPQPVARHDSAAGLPRGTAVPPRGLAAVSCYAAALRVSGDSGREVEAAEGVWGEEGGDLLDLRATQGEHVDSVRHEGLRLVVPRVGKEGELPVRANGDETPARRPGQQPAAEEDSDLFATAVPGWQGRHRHLRVVGEHGDDRVNVVALPGGDLALHNLSQRTVTK
jgi:hypothetical protein